MRLPRFAGFAPPPLGILCMSLSVGLGWWNLKPGLFRMLPGGGFPAQFLSYKESFEAGFLSSYIVNNRAGESVRERKDELSIIKDNNGLLQIDIIRVESRSSHRRAARPSYTCTYIYIYIKSQDTYASDPFTSYVPFNRFSILPYLSLCGSLGGRI